MGIRAGAREIGLTVNWRFSFVGHGTVMETTRGVVYLDVGNRLCPGVIDQHQDNSLGNSTSEILLRAPQLVHEHLLGGWLDLRDAGHNLEGRVFSPVIVTHVAPDFDAMVSSWLAVRLVEDGDFPPEAEALVAYAAMVDQGRYPVDLDRPETATHAIHMAYLATQNRNIPFEEQLRQGHRLLDHISGRLRAANEKSYSVANFLPSSMVSGRNAKTSVADSWRKEEQFSEERKLLDEDFLLFKEKDLPLQLSLDPAGVLVPADDGGVPIPTPAFFASAPVSSRLNKYWVRALGYPYFLCSYPARAEMQGPRVIISLDPNWSKDGRKPTLRGLGRRLEAAETIARASDVALIRRGVPRWPDGSCDNDDPWYDGRGHAYMIIDTPRVGTVLPLARLVGLATAPFWEVLLREVDVCILLPETAVADTTRSSAMQTPTSHPDTVWKAPLRSWCASTKWEQFDRPESVLAQRLPPLPKGLQVQSLQRCILPDGSGVAPNSSGIVRKGSEPTGRSSDFPARICPPFHVVNLSLDPSAELTAQDLHKWLEAVREGGEHPGRSFAVARVVFEEHFEAFLSMPRVINLFSPPGSEIRRDGGSFTVYTGHTVVMGGRGGSDANALFRHVCEALRYAAFQDEALQAYTRQIVQVIGGDTDSGQGRKDSASRSEELRRSFLRFHAGYVHMDALLDSHASIVYSGIRSALALPAQYAKAFGDIERLAELERSIEAAAASKAAEDASNARVTEERKLAGLVFIVGLAGVFQAFGVDYSSVHPIQFVTGVAVAVFLTGGFFYVRYKSTPPV